MTQPSASLKVETREAADGTVVVDVSGDLVVTNRDALGEALEDALGRRRAVIVSCADLDHLDTPALALLVQMRQRYAEERIGFAVAALPSRFSDLMADTRIREEFTLLDTVEEGLDPDDA